MENLIYFSLISLCYCLLFYIHKSGTGSLFITILLLLVLLYVIFNVFSSYFCCGCIVIVPSVYQMWIRIIPCEMGNNNILLPAEISGFFLFSVLVWFKFCKSWFVFKSKLCVSLSPLRISQWFMVLEKLKLRWR